jgi:hypothetical protein
LYDSLGQAYNPGATAMNQSSSGQFGGMSGMNVLPSQMNPSFPPQYNLNPLAHSVAAQSNALKPKTPKKRKDPNAPKAVRNAYMIFCQMTRNKLKAQHPELSFGKLGGRMGEMWRLMTATEKAPYEKLALEDRDRYRTEMLKWQQGKASNK